MKATEIYGSKNLPGGRLIPLEDCYIDIPDLGETIYMNNLPDISDSKGANFPDTAAVGRSMPFKSYEASENRSISWQCHFIICNEGDADTNLRYLRLLEACVYPQKGFGSSYAPPPTLHVKCGKLLRESDTVCCILRKYSIKFDPQVPWDEKTYIPYKFDVDLDLEVVYNQENLPNADTIVEAGY